jgi:hypothetical protein
VKFFLFSICQSWLSLLIRGWLTYTEWQNACVCYWLML